MSARRECEKLAKGEYGARARPIARAHVERLRRDGWTWWVATARDGLGRAVRFQISGAKVLDAIEREERRRHTVVELWVVADVHDRSLTIER